MTLFSDLKLDQNVLKAINEVGYDKPTPIQAGAIPPALEGRDVLGIAQTGTGKTASFTLPVITLLSRGRARARMPRSLVLAPTRELAAQVAENFDLYAKYTRLTKALLIGGVSFSEQDKLIDRGVDVLIATPGRLLDHFERGKLLLTGVQIMVVDEADRMLDMGFIPDIERIFQLTPANRQTLFFSATMAPEIERITNTFLHSPERIEVARQATTSENIEQRLIELTPSRKDQAAKQKRELLRAIITSEGEALKNAIIFSNRKTDVDIVAKSLRVHGYDAQAIHGDLDQNHRTKTLDDFREGRLRFLVASDVAARGLDIPAVSHVFNFDLPSHAEDYVHRIGRTGRAGRKGTAISISVPSDEKYLTAIENLVKHALPRVQAPEGFKVTEAPRNARNADTAPEPRNARSRTRSRNPRNEEVAPAQPVVETPVVREQAAPQQNRAPQQRSNGDDDRRKNQGSRQTERAPRQQDDRSRSGVIVGMGDHVPEFLTRSFYEALEATERASAETAANVVEQAATTDSTPVETSERPSSSRRNNRRRGGSNSQASKAVVETPEAVVTEQQPEAETTTAAIQPAAEPVKEVAPAPQQDLPASEAAPATTEIAEVAVADVPEVKKPAPRSRTPRSRITAAAKPVAETAEPTEVEVPAPTEAVEEPAKPAATPKRTTTRKAPAASRSTAAKKAAEAEATSGAEAAPDAAEKPAPATRRRAATTRKAPAVKKAEEAPASEEATPATEAAAVPAPKPRATRARATTAAKPAAAKPAAAKATTTKAAATKAAAAKPAAPKAAAPKVAAKETPPETGGDAPAE